MIVSAVKEITARQPLRNLARIEAGYQSRGRIEPAAGGTHWLLQVGDIDERRECVRAEDLVRFSPGRSAGNAVVNRGDVLFMAKGATHFALALPELPVPTLAAGYFFITRVTGSTLLPEYVAWYLNQDVPQRYFRQQAGQGVNMPVVRIGVLGECEVPVPPLAIQRQIVELDALRREEEHLLVRLAEKRRLLLGGACLRAIEQEQR
jgi:hypothetical protein